MPSADTTHGHTDCPGNGGQRGQDNIAVCCGDVVERNAVMQGEQGAGGGGGLFGYPVRRRSQSSWSSTSCCHHPGAGPSELSTPSGPTQPHWGQSGLPALGLTPMARAAGRNPTQTLAVMSPTPQPLGHTAA